MLGSVEKPLEVSSEFLALEMADSVAESASGLYDSFSNWLLAGFAGAMALLMVNRAEFGAVLDDRAVRRLGLWFVASFIAALAAKYMASQVGRFVAVHRAATARLQITDTASFAKSLEIIQPAFSELANALSEALPQPLRSLVGWRKSRGRATKDVKLTFPLLRAMHYQRLLTNLQALAFILGVVDALGSQW